MNRIWLSGIFQDKKENYYGVGKLTPNTAKFYNYLLNNHGKATYIYYMGKQRSKDIFIQTGLTTKEVQEAVEELKKSGNINQITEATGIFNVLQPVLTEEFLRKFSEEYPELFNRAFTISDD